jgi:hypothetical protein
MSEPSSRSLDRSHTRFLRKATVSGQLLTFCAGLLTPAPIPTAGLLALSSPVQAPRSPLPAHWHAPCKVPKNQWIPLPIWQLQGVQSDFVPTDNSQKLLFLKALAGGVYEHS